VSQKRITASDKLVSHQETINQLEKRSLKSCCEMVFSENARLSKMKRKNLLQHVPESLLIALNVLRLLYRESTRLPEEKGKPMI